MLAARSLKLRLETLVTVWRNVHYLRTMYGKQVRPGRKIGHVTVVGEDPEDLADRARRAASYLRWGKEDGD